MGIYSAFSDAKPKNYQKSVYFEKGKYVVEVKKTTQVTSGAGTLWHHVDFNVLKANSSIDDCEGEVRTWSQALRQEPRYAQMDARNLTGFLAAAFDLDEEEYEDFGEEEWTEYLAEAFEEGGIDGVLLNLSVNPNKNGFNVHFWEPASEKDLD